MLTLYSVRFFLLTNAANLIECGQLLYPNPFVTGAQVYEECL